MTMETEFSEAILVIADMLGVTAERVFDIFVGAQVTMGIISLISILFTIFCCVMTFSIIYRRIIKYKRDMNDDEMVSTIFLSFVGMFVVLFVTMLILKVVSDGMMQIYHPEYSAMKEIIELVR